MANEKTTMYHCDTFLMCDSLNTCKKDSCKIFQKEYLLGKRSSSLLLHECYHSIHLYSPMKYYFIKKIIHVYLKTFLFLVNNVCLSNVTCYYNVFTEKIKWLLYIIPIIVWIIPAWVISKLIPSVSITWLKPTGWHFDIVKL